MERLCYPSERLCSQVLTRKVALNKPVSVSADRHGIRGCEPLNSGCNVWGFSEGKLLLSPTTAHFTDYDETRVYPYPDGELDTFGLLQTLIQVSQGSKNSQPSPYGSLGIIFMGLGVAEIHQETVTQELSNVTIIALDHLRANLLIRTYHFSVIFGIKLAGEFRGGLFATI